MSDAERFYLEPTWTERGEDGRVRIAAVFREAPGWQVVVLVDGADEPPAIVSVTVRRGGEPLKEYLLAYTKAVGGTIRPPPTPEQFEAENEPERVESVRRYREAKAAFERRPIASRSVTAGLLRSIRMEDLQAMVNERLRAPGGADSPQLPDPTRARGHGSEYHYATVAAHYVRAVQAGSTQPAKDVAETLGLVSGAAARACLQRARRRDLLTPTEPGKGGGKLTQKALDLLGLTEAAFERQIREDGRFSAPDASPTPLR